MIKMVHSSPGGSVGIGGMEFFVRPDDSIEVPGNFADALRHHGWRLPTDPVPGMEMQKQIALDALKAVQPFQLPPEARALQVDLAELRAVYEATVSAGRTVRIQVVDLEQQVEQLTAANAILAERVGVAETALEASQQALAAAMAMPGAQDGQQSNAPEQKGVAEMPKFYAMTVGDLRNLVQEQGLECDISTAPDITAKRALVKGAWAAKNGVDLVPPAAPEQS